MISIPLKTSSGLNAREHFAVRSKRVKREREAVSWTLVQHERPTVPCSVTLTRVAPSSGLDDDNLVGSLKAVRDEIAAWLKVDDKDRMTVRYRYAQKRGPWAVEISFGPPVEGAQLRIDSPTETFGDLAQQALESGVLQRFGAT